MDTFKVNIVANLLGRIWPALLGVVVIPFYLKFLGIEAYGLVGIFATIQAVFSLLDLGLGAGFSRELARLAAREGTAQDQRDLLRTLELIYYGISIVIGAVVVLLAPAIAHHWVHTVRLSPTAVENSIRLMGLCIAAQFPFAFYQGGLVGLQKQPLNNAILVVSGTVRSLGALAILWLVSNTITSFFVWQTVIAFGSAAAAAVAIRRVLPAAGVPRFRLDLLKDVWRFAIGWAGNSVGLAVAGQVDKVVLTRFLSLQQFGYYSLAQTIAMYAWNIVGPVTVAAFPRFIQAVARNSESELRSEYRRSSELLGVLLLPLLSILGFFAWQVVSVWTRNPSIADNTALLLTLFAAGMACAGCVAMTNELQLAHSWFRLTITMTIATAVCAVPFTIILSRQFGALGAAIVWSAQNASFLIVVPIAHRRYLRHEATHWFVHSFFAPLGIAALICAASRLAMPQLQGRFLAAAYVGTTWLIATAAAAAITPSVRETLLARFRTLRTTGEAA